MNKTLLAAAIGGLMFSSASLTAGAQIIVRVRPPERIVEEVPAPPSEHPNYVWHPGYHKWDGNAYVWVPGSYVAAPREHDVWIEGKWVADGDGWVWHEGHWKD
ncbi:MAG: hypothetical protein M3R43_11280 [Acidobacteriota bacterium]|nr:hypothetical protein [Acidobacteriota bacterium]